MTSISCTMHVREEKVPTLAALPFLVDWPRPCPETGSEFATSPPPPSPSLLFFVVQVYAAVLELCLRTVRTSLTAGRNKEDLLTQWYTGLPPQAIIGPGSRKLHLGALKYLVQVHTLVLCGTGVKPSCLCGGFVFPFLVVVVVAAAAAAAAAAGLCVRLAVAVVCCWLKGKTGSQGRDLSSLNRNGI